MPQVGAEGGDAAFCGVYGGTAWRFSRTRADSPPGLTGKAALTDATALVSAWEDALALIDRYPGSTGLGSRCTPSSQTGCGRPWRRDPARGAGDRGGKRIGRGSAGRRHHIGAPVRRHPAFVDYHRADASPAN